MNHDRPVISIVDLTFHIGARPIVAPFNDLLRILSNSSTGRDGIVVVAVVAKEDSGAASTGQAIAREWLAIEGGGHAAEARHGLELGGLVQDVFIVGVRADDLVA